MKTKDEIINNYADEFLWHLMPFGSLDIMYLARKAYELDITSEELADILVYFFANYLDDPLQYSNEVVDILERAIEKEGKDNIVLNKYSIYRRIIMYLPSKYSPFMTVEEILELMDFDLIKTKTHCKLKDLTGANLNNIQNEIYELNLNTPTVLMDRLSTYIYDYFISDLAELTDISLSKLSELSYKELSIVARRIKDKDTRRFYRRLFTALDRPNILLVL